MANRPSRRLAGYVPLALVGVGLLVRLLHLLAWDVPKGFDFTEHWKYILFLLATGHVPLASDVLPTWLFHALRIGSGSFRASYHPPLFYLLAKLFVPDALHPVALFRSARMIELARRVAYLSLAAGVARLLLLERFLARAFPGALLARSLAVGLAALLPCALRMDQTVSPESLAATLLGGSLYLVLLSVEEGTAARQIAFAAAAGLVAGGALLTKYTGLVALGTFGAAYGAQWLFARTKRPQAALSLALALGCAVGVAGGYYLRNQRTCGKLFPDSYDYSLAYEKGLARASQRDLLWYVPFDPKVLWQPVWSTGWRDRPNYWSQMVATAWGDFFSTRYLTHDVGGEPILVNGRGITPLGIASMIAVLWLALPATIALFWGLLVWIRRALSAPRREWPIAAPALAMALGALAVAFVNTWKNAIESDGPTKSEYALAATPILCAIAGFALAAAVRRWPRLRKPLAIDLALLALVLLLQAVVL